MVARSSDLFQICQTEASIDKKTQMLELQVAMFVVQKNLPFSIADDFVNFLKKIDMDKKFRRNFVADAQNVMRWFVKLLEDTVKTSLSKG